MHTIPDWQFRAPARADAGDITRLIQSSNLHVSGEADFDANDLDAEWGLEGFDLERHAFVAVRDGAITAYANFRARRPREDYDADFSVHPDHASAELERRVLEELERRTRADMAGAPGGARALLHVHADHDERERLDLFTAMGFEPCRWFFRMGIDLTGPPANITPPPAGVEIRSCQRGVDEVRFYDVLRDAFQGHYRFVPLERDDWVKRHSGYDFYVSDLWQLAWHGDHPVGASCNLLYEDAGWVDELGVRADWRGRKLGRALLDASFAAFWKHGQPRVRLGVDADNATGATRLYENAGMTVLTKYVLCRKVIEAGA
jgi:ribosomal protein S18 acetylase RimI-like enzyme